MTSPSTRRLLKESTDLHKNPSPYFTAAPTSDSNLHDWHFTLAGPPTPTPYAGGFYHGRIAFPPTYPLRPPSFRFLTPSGRFEVNREICLSISGHHEETWQPAWGVRTALLAIRSEIMSAESKGQVGGMESSDELRREYARLSVEWTCRECGESNGEIMRGLWDTCKERGVEIDIEGEGPSGGSTSTTEAPAEQKNEEESEAQRSPADSTSADTAPPTMIASAEEAGHETTPEINPSIAADANPQPQTISSLPQSAATSIPGPAPASEVAPEAATRPEVPRTAAAPPASTLAQRSTQSRAATITTATNVSNEPANSPWLDRAILVVAFALIVMVLRRVSDVNDL